MARTAVVRLAAFALVLLGSFGTAYGLGRRLPGNPESKPHTHGPAKPSPVPPGFDADGYTLVNGRDPADGRFALRCTSPARTGRVSLNSPSTKVPTCMWC